MSYLLITLSLDLDHPDIIMESYPSAKEAMAAHKTDWRWAVVAYPALDPGEIDVKMVTVYYYNIESIGIGVQGQQVITAAVQRWTKVTRT